MTTVGAGDIARRKAEIADNRRANRDAFFDSACKALLSGTDYGSATYDGVVERISDTEDLAEILIDARRSGRWSDVEAMIDKAIDDEARKALSEGLAA